MSRQTKVVVSLIAVLMLFCVARPVTSRQRSVDIPPRTIPANLAPVEILRQLQLLRQPRDHYPEESEAPDALDRFVADTWKGLKLPDTWKGRCIVCGSLLLEEEQASRWVVLRLNVDGDDYRFLVFLAPLGSRDSWRLDGYADTSSHYGIPSYRLELTPNGSYLVVSHNTGGTGAFEEGESWYELNPDRSSEVVSYPTEGHNDPFWGGTSNGKEYILSRYWETKSIHRPDERDPVLRIELEVQYSFYDDAGSQDLFSKKQVAVFTWDASSKTYKLDEKVSGMTRAELESVYKIDSLHGQEFIKYNFDALRQIAEQGTAARKVWLRSLLTDLGADPLATDLLRRIR